MLSDQAVVGELSEDLNSQPTFTAIELVFTVPEVLSEIFSYLDAKSFLNIRRVSTLFKTLIDNVTTRKILLARYTQEEATKLFIYSSILFSENDAIDMFNFYSNLSKKNLNECLKNPAQFLFLVNAIAKKRADTNIFNDDKDFISILIDAAHLINQAPIENKNKTPSDDDLAYDLLVGKLDWFSNKKYEGFLQRIKLTNVYTPAMISHFQAVLAAMHMFTEQDLSAQDKARANASQKIQARHQAGQYIRMNFNNLYWQEALLNDVLPTESIPQQKLIDCDQLKNINFSYSSFSLSNLDNKILDRIDFRSTTWRGVTCANSTLIRVSFASATMSHCDFTGSRMLGVDLSDVILNAVCLDNCDLSNANLIGMTLKAEFLYGLNVSNVILKGAWFLSGSVLKSTTEFNEALTTLGENLLISKMSQDEIINWLGAVYADILCLTEGNKNQKVFMKQAKHHSLFDAVSEKKEFFALFKSSKPTSVDTETLNSENSVKYT